MSRPEILSAEALKQVIESIVSAKMQRSPIEYLLDGDDNGLVSNLEFFQKYLELGYSYYVVIYPAYVDFFEVKKKKGWGINNYEGDVQPPSIEGKIINYDYVAFPNTRTGEVILLLKEQANQSPT
jgi:hypothetical protein